MVSRSFLLSREKIDLFLIIILILSAIIFLLFSVVYLSSDRPLASLLSFLIGIILLSSGLSIYRFMRSGM